MNYGNSGIQISEDLAIASMFLTFIVDCFAITITALIIYHFMLAIPLYKMAYNAGYDYPFLAFIPSFTRDAISNGTTISIATSMIMLKGVRIDAFLYSFT